MDKIIISSNDKCAEIIRWYDMNKDWLDANFTPALNDGEMYLIEENTKCIFNTMTTTDNILFKLFFLNDKTNNYIFICSWQYNIEKNTMSNLYYSNKNEITQLQMTFMMAQHHILDNTILKYRAVMSYMNHHIELIKPKNKGKGKHRTTTPHKNNERSLPLGKKLYVIDKDTEVPKEKRKYTPCDYEFPRRSTFRHLKSGKVVPVKGTTVNKGKGKKRDKVYKA